MLDISIPAKLQEHKRTMLRFSVAANYDDMDGLEADTKLINDLCAWAKVKPSRMATDLGMAATTLTRPANGKATTRIGRNTLEVLKGKYPEFPGWAQSAAPESNAIPFQMEGASAERMQNNLPVYGTALGAARRVDGDAVEQTTLNKAEVVMYAKRPVLLNGRTDAYGLLVSGSSMEPRHMDGETILVDPQGRVRPGEDVIVYLRPINPEEDDGQSARAVLVKRLVRRTATYMELEQYTPPIRFRVEMDEIVRVDRVIPWSELLG